MNPSALWIKAVLVVLIAMFWTGATSREGLLWAAGKESERFHPAHGYRMFPQRYHNTWGLGPKPWTPSHRPWGPEPWGSGWWGVGAGNSESWGSGPGWFLHDGYPQPPCTYRPYWHPARPGHYRPLHPPSAFLPYFTYPPSFEHQKPWYEGEALIPAGRLHILVAPVEAEAYVDGYPLERNPDLSYEVGLLEGEHQVEVSAEGHVPYRTTVEIQGGQKMRLTIRLERAAEQ